MCMYMTIIICYLRSWDGDIPNVFMRVKCYNYAVEVCYVEGTLMIKCNLDINLLGLLCQLRAWQTKRQIIEHSMAKKNRNFSNWGMSTLMHKSPSMQKQVAPTEIITILACQILLIIVWLDWASGVTVDHNITGTGLGQVLSNSKWYFSRNKWSTFLSS